MKIIINMSATQESGAGEALLLSYPQIGPLTAPTGQEHYLTLGSPSAKEVSGVVPKCLSRFPNQSSIKTYHGL